MRMRILLISVFLVSFASSCSVKKMAAKNDLSYLYFPTTFKLHPEFTLRHFSDTVISVHFRFSPKELLTIVDSSLIDSLSYLSIGFELYNTNFEPIDSSSIHFYHKDIHPNKVLQGVQNINTLKNDFFYLYITSFNSLNNYQNVQLFMVDTTIHAYNFNKLSRNLNGLSSFSNVYNANQHIDLSELNPDSIYLSYYKPQDYLYQSAVYDSIPIEFSLPDTSYWYKESTRFSMALRGKYILKPDSLSKDSLCFFNFGANYPKTEFIGNLIGPLQYIANFNEFQSILNANNPKLAYDNFWLRITGEINKARELIRIYNSRVFYANLYFNSDREGWKTDRGMIYIIYGFPDQVRVSNDSEIWYYGDYRKKGYTKFEFKKNGNACTQNDFVLQRNKNINSQWLKAIQTWREGNIYTVINYGNGE